MTALDSLQRQITTTQELQSVVKTMKVLAATSIRQYERAVESLVDYTRTIEIGLQMLLSESTDYLQRAALTDTAKNHRLGAIVFGSDQGMCGQFNEQIAHSAVMQIKSLSLLPADLTVFAVGTRVIPPLEAAGQALAATLPMPSSLAGITSMVQELLLHIETWSQEQQIGRILLFYNRPGANTAFASEMIQLLPLDQSWLQHLQQQQQRGKRSLPMWTMDSSELFASLIRQYFFVFLYRAFAESLASENASRLASMQVAEQNIETRLAEFNAQFQQQRQTSITEEILEIMSGFEVLTQQTPQ